MNNDLTATLKALENWIESWRQNNNSYTGIISTFWESTFDTIQSNGIHQAPIINAYLNLYQKTNNPILFQKASTIAHSLLHDFDHQKGHYKSLFADMPGKIAGPILNIECNLALLRLYKEYKHALNNPEQYLSLVIHNVDNYLFKKWWDGTVWNNYVANQIAKGGEMFLELYQITKQQKYLDYAINAGDWLIKHQIKQGTFKGALEQSLFDSRLILVYEAACLPFWDKLYKQTNDIKYQTALNNLIQFVKKCELDNGGFIGFFEQSLTLKIINLLLRRLKFLQFILFPLKNVLISSNPSSFIKKTNPIFISRLAEILLNIHKTDNTWNLEKHIRLITNNQLESGGIKNCLGTPPSTKNIHWTQDAPVMRWGVFVFELLSSLLPSKSDYSDAISEIPASLTKVMDYGYFIENQKYFGFLRIKNNKMILERLFIKNNSKPIVENLELGSKTESSILIVTPSFPPETGGCSSRMSDFVHFLNKSQLNIHMLTNLVPNSAKKELNNNTIINRIPLFVSFRSPRRFVDTFIWLWKYILDNNINIIMVTIPPGLHAAVALLVVTLLRKKLIVDVRDPWIDGEVFTGTIQPGSLKHRFGQYIEKKLYQKATKITLVYKRLNEQIKQRYKIDTTKTTWIPNGINTELSVNTDLLMPQSLKDKTIFLYQGLMARPQAVHRILDFIPQILKIVPNAMFVFIGYGETKDDITKAVRIQNLSQYTVFLDKMSRPEVLQWVSKSDYGIVTLDDKFTYAIPSKTFDYLIFQKPIIATVPINGEIDTLIQKYNLGINLLRDDFRKLEPVPRTNSIFVDYSRKNNSKKLEQLIAKIND